MSQYIGKTISLISSKGIRYVGQLAGVNGEEATLTLKNVKPYGTEGRLGDPAKEIAAVDDVYPIVVFRGADVRDLSVLDDPVEETKKEEDEEKKKATAEESASEKEESKDKSEEEPQESPEETPLDKTEQKWERNSEVRHQRKPRPFVNNNQNDAFYNASVPDTEFDFEKANRKLEEMKLNEEEDPMQRPKDDDDNAEPAYDKKKSFFDNISNSATEKRPQRPDFGHSYGQGRPNFGNNGRPNFGNNSWGRGRGRGRGRRGGYQGQWSQEDN